jgi:hypothetical protein
MLSISSRMNVVDIEEAGRAIALFWGLSLFTYHLGTPWIKVAERAPPNRRKLGRFSFLNG